MSLYLSGLLEQKYDRFCNNLTDLFEPYATDPGKGLVFKSFLDTMQVPPVNVFPFMLNDVGRRQLFSDTAKRRLRRRLQGDWIIIFQNI